MPLLIPVVLSLLLSSPNLVESKPFVAPSISTSATFPGPGISDTAHSLTHFATFAPFLHRIWRAAIAGESAGATFKETAPDATLCSKITCTNGS